MDSIINLGVILAFALGMILFILSIFVLHTYEEATKKRPPSVNFWPFNKEIKEFYPGLTKLGRIIQIATLICALPYILKLIIST